VLTVPDPPPAPPTQVPFTEKHPPARLIPFVNDEVAEPVTFRRLVAIPPVNVDVADDEPKKYVPATRPEDPIPPANVDVAVEVETMYEVLRRPSTTASPATESVAYGVDVPIPKRLFVLSQNRAPALSTVVSEEG